MGGGVLGVGVLVLGGAVGAGGEEAAEDDAVEGRGGAACVSWLGSCGIYVGCRRGAVEVIRRGRRERTC